jgi:hypothetical protein
MSTDVNAHEGQIYTYNGTPVYMLPTLQLQKALASGQVTIEMLPPQRMLTRPEAAAALGFVYHTFYLRKDNPDFAHDIQLDDGRDSHRWSIPRVREIRALMHARATQSGVISKAAAVRLQRDISPGIAAE